MGGLPHLGGGLEIWHTSGGPGGSRLKAIVQSGSQGSPQQVVSLKTPSLGSADWAVPISGILTAEKNSFCDGWDDWSTYGCCRGGTATRKTADTGVWKFYASVLCQCKVLIELSNADTVSQEHLYFICDGWSLHLPSQGALWIGRGWGKLNETPEENLQLIILFLS